MTFDEFIGIKNADIDIETGKRMEHHDIYKRAIERFGGLEVIKQMIPYSIEQICKALEDGDEYLNTLPMSQWDFAAGFYCTDANCIPQFGSRIWNLYKRNGITSASCSQGVCLLKEAARMWAKEVI